jgi:predicted AAA+ superfamily ATPase
MQFSDIVPAGVYLKEEIQAEGLTRSIGSFFRFLEVAATVNGEQVIFSSVANDAQIPARTVRDHFQVLEDTLVGSLLPAFRGTKTRKAMASAKFYFFDVGVANALLERRVSPARHVRRD